MKYIPINVKTNYELLSSLIKIDDLISFLKANNINCIGITDSNMFNIYEIYRKLKENNIKLLIGTTIFLYDKKILLYAKNFEGYKNLCKIVSKKNLDNLDIDFLREKANNIIAVIKPFSNLYEMVSSIYKEVFISYENIDEKKEALIISKNIVFSNEILYLEENEKQYLEYLYMIRDGETIYNHKDYDIKNNHYLKEVLEIDARTTLAFSELIDIDFPEFNFVLPKYKENSKELFYSLCKKGLEKRLNGNVKKEYSDRLMYEIKVIEKMGFIDYFLIVYDFILYSKKNKIVVGPGRGSAAGSLVSFSLGITNVDPIKFDLIFERFLNPERITMPDIDIDFEYLRRDEVVSYVREKYGKENVANIITFGTLLPKQVIRDVGRVLEIDLRKIDAICKSIDDKMPLKEILKKPIFFELLKEEEIKTLFNIALKLENLKRHTSVHAAGVVISEEVLTNKMPLYKSGESILTSFTMDYLEDLGLLKMDFLALRNLTIIDNVLKNIKDKEFDLNKIPLSNKEAIKIFNEVNTVGIFQFESEGMKNFLREFKVTSFDDVVAAIALYRPGPREMIPTYIKRKKGLEKVSYILPVLEPILKSTYGIIIYQEQILEILRKVASYSYAEADNIRRAMSKKKEEVILKERENFILRSVKNGYDKYKAEEIYELVLKFANYGFNKAHSVAYSLIAYQMAYLKANYKNEFMISLLNMVSGREEKTKEYIDESKLLGIKFKNVSVNKSSKDYKEEDGYIIYPLSVIKGLGEKSINEILEEREKGEFRDIYDFFARIHRKSINKKIIESLIKAGALSEFKLNKKTLMENLDELINYSSLCSDIDASLVLKPEINYYEEYNEAELMDVEYNTFGFYINNHPVSKYKRNDFRIKDIKNYFDKYISSIFLIDSIKTINTKKNEKMAFLIVSDETGKSEAVIFPKLYINYDFIKKGDIIKIKGKVEKRQDSFQIIINEIEVEE